MIIEDGGTPREARTMDTRTRGIPVVRKPIGTAIAEVEAMVARMERKYACSTAEMDERIQSGAVLETAKINQWLGEHEVLLGIQRRVAGRADG